MVYEPQEDSYLLLGQVRKRIKNGDVLEIGTGTGLIAFEAAKKADSVTAIDIDPQALSLCQREKARLISTGDKDAGSIKFKKSDLFSDVKRKFDWIIFNPPYLPLDKREPEDSRLATTGGKEGHEITEKFLDASINFLKVDGKILLLFSTSTGKKKVEQIIKNDLLEFEEVDSQKIPFEKLYVYLLKKGAGLKKIESEGVTNIAHLTKGHRGMIFTGQIGKKKVAIKVQRKDIGASGTVDNEARQLVKLNKHGIGPTILFAGKDLFGYNFVEGKFIFNFIEDANRKNIILVFRELMGQMRKLDMLSVNKEEMHHPYKHIIVGKDAKGRANRIKVTLIDFERCKPTLKPHNVTQLWQFFTSGQMDHALKGKDITFDSSKIMKLSRTYKRALVKGEDSDEPYDKLMEMLK